MTSPAFDISVFQFYVQEAHSLYRSLGDVSLSLTGLLFVITMYIGYYHEFRSPYDLAGLLKRLFIAILLVVNFPLITETLLNISDGICSFVNQSGQMEQYGFNYIFKTAAKVWASGGLMRILMDHGIWSIVFLLSFFLLLCVHVLINCLVYLAYAVLVVMGVIINCFFVVPALSQVTVRHLMWFVRLGIYKLILFLLSGLVVTKAIVAQYEAADPNYLWLSVLNVILALIVLVSPVFAFFIIDKFHSIGAIVAHKIISPATAAPRFGARRLYDKATKSVHKHLSEKDTI